MYSGLLVFIITPVTQFGLFKTNQERLDVFAAVRTTILKGFTIYFKSLS